MESLMTSYLKTGPYIQMYETTCRVFGEPERENTQKSYMWLAGPGRTGETSGGDLPVLPDKRGSKHTGFYHRIFGLPSD
jgi:hypothetical protein